MKFRNLALKRSCLNNLDLRHVLVILTLLFSLIFIVTDCKNLIAQTSNGDHLNPGATETPTSTATPCLAPGTLDTTFDGDGKVITRLRGNASSSIAIQVDGKMVGVGYISTGSTIQFLVVRYNYDGSLDNSFGEGGQVTASFGSDNSLANDVAIQSDGKIVVVGSAKIGSTNDFAIARFNADGSLDSSFDDDGIVTTAVPGPHGNGTDIAYSVAIQSDGKLIVAGRVPDGSGTSSDFGIVRYNPDGSVDPTFGLGGKATAAFGGPNVAQSVALQPDGKIVMAGSGGSSLAIARYNSDGSFDNSFGGNGRLSTSFGQNAFGYEIALQPDNKILAAGRNGGLNGNFAVARFNSNGTFDSSFGADGIATTPIDGNRGAANSVVIQLDGKIVAAGQPIAAPFSGFVTVRYNSDGTLDTSFDYDGLVITQISNGNDLARSIALQMDGKIITAGGIDAGSSGGVGMVRYNGAPCGPPTATPTETLTQTPTATATQSPTVTSTLTDTPTATPTAIPHSSCTFDNGGSGGGLNPQALTESGVAAPEGFFWSEVQHDAGNLDEANNVAGFNARQGLFRLADNFSIAQPCRIDSINLYGYQIDAPETPSPFTACTLRIWKGRPGDLGSKIVFGDTTTNRLASSVDTAFYRIFNTVAPPPGTVPVTTNKIWKNTITVGTTLPAGTYWIDWASTVTDGGNHFYPNKTIAGSRGFILDDARKFSFSANQWSDAVDSGQPFSAPDYKQDFPFNVIGEVPSPTSTSTSTLTPTPTSTPTTPVTECDLVENFDDVTTLSATGWPEINNSSPLGAGTWFQGNDEVFASYEGAANSYIAVNYQSGSGNSTLSNWLLTPPLLLQNGGQLTFWTRTVDNPAFPDRLQVRMSTNGNSIDVGTSSTDVGDFTSLLLDINPTYTLNAYPNVWTQYVVTVTNLKSPVKGRLAFRYFVENGGPSGDNSDYIGIDSVTYKCVPITSSPTATLTDTPTDTPTKTPTDTNTPTATPTDSPVISGVVTYGNAKVPPQYVSHVKISGSGSNNVSTATSYPDGAYSLAGFGAGSYTLTPSKPLGPSNGITSFDAALVAQHVAGMHLLTGNQLLVADVSNNGEISSFDASQIARYAISSPPYGIAGMWKFIPESREYSSITASISGEDYSALLMAEVSGNWGDNNMRPATWPEQSVSVQAPQLSISGNSEVTIPVAVKGAAYSEIISCEFDLRYDPSVIQPQVNVVDLSETVSRGFTVATNIAEPGLLKVAIFSPTPIYEDGVLLNLRFTAVGARESISPLTWERIMFNEGDPSAITTDGIVALSAAATGDH